MKSCFAAFLVFVVSADRCVAQEFVAEDFGKRLTQKVSAGSVSPPNEGDSAEQPRSPIPVHDSSDLIQPAICNTPDGYFHPVQQAGHTEPAGEVSSRRDRPAAHEQAGSATALSANPRSDAAPSRKLPFPDLAPADKSRAGGVRPTSATAGLGSVLTVISSLALVLGLFFITAWFLRRTGTGNLAVLPNDVFEPLGRAQLSNRQQVHLLRFGTKLLLVSVTPEGAETLAEIDDPDEASRLVALCKANQAGSATAAFRQVLNQFARQPAEPGFVGRPDLVAGRDRLPSELENLHG